MNFPNLILNSRINYSVFPESLRRNLRESLEGRKYYFSDSRERLRVKHIVTYGQLIEYLSSIDRDASKAIRGIRGVGKKGAEALRLDLLNKGLLNYIDEKNKALEDK